MTGAREGDPGSGDGCTEGGTEGLAEVLALDLVLARQFQRRHDFPEGVRALLIDKDRKPRWAHADLAAVPIDEVEAHFR